MSAEAATDATINATIGGDPSAGEKSKPDEGYEVGYGRPPRSGQFRPGRSGNPRGRRKGEKTLKSTLHAVMGERITVHTGKGAKRLTKMEALVQRVTNGALSGEAAATRQLLAMMQLAGLHAEMGEALDADRTARMMDEDRAILERLLGKPD